MKNRSQLKNIWVKGQIINYDIISELFDSTYVILDDPFGDTYETRIGLSGNTLILTRNDGVRISQDLSGLSFPDYYVTGATLSGNNLILTRNDGVEIEQDLSSLVLPDYYVTGTTLDGNNLILTRNDGVEIEQDLSGLNLDDYYVTGTTLDGNFLILTRNDGVRITQDLSSLTFPDYYVTGTTLDGNNLILTRNDDVEIEQDLSSLVLPDYYVTGTTLDGNNLILTRNDGFRISQDLSGLSFPDYYVTGTTLDGNTLVLTRNDTVEIEQDLSTLNLDEIYESGVTFNSLSDVYPYTLTIKKTNNINTTVNLSSLANDAYGLFGAYSGGTGIVGFTNTTGGTLDVLGFLTGYTDTYINGMSFSGSTLTINRENGVDLTQSIIFPDSIYSYHSLSANTNDISLSGNDIVEIGMDDYSYSALTFSNPLVKNYTLLFKHIYDGYPPFTLPSIKNYSFTFNSFIEDTDFYSNLGTGFNGAGLKSVVVQSDGNILVGGHFTTFSGKSRNYLVRLSGDGTEDIAFYSNLGTGFAGSVYPIAVQSDGKILVGGNYITFNGVTRNRLVRLNADGTEDTAFYSNLGTAFNSIPISVAIQLDGKILVGGQFTTFNGQSRNRLVRLNADGTEDTDFYSNLGNGFFNTVNSIAIQSDGKILVGGQFTSFNNPITRNYLLRLNADGTEDTNFYANLGTAFNGYVNSIAIQSDGKILVGGEFSYLGSKIRNRLVRLNADGTEDSAFYINLISGFNNSVNSITIQSDGKILVGGGFSRLDTKNRSNLVRLNSNGTEDTLFYISLGAGFNSVTYSIVIQSDGKILIGGGFNYFDNQSRNALVRLNGNNTSLSDAEYSVLQLTYNGSVYKQA